MTTAKSAYPTPLADLLPRARELAERLDRVPSRNRLMSELKIGAPKANLILERLGQPSVEPEANPARLRLVGEPEPDSGAGLTHDEPAKPTEQGELSNPPSDPAEQGLKPPANEPDSHAGKASAVTESGPVTTDADPARPGGNGEAVKQVPRWPVLLLALPAFVAIWSGWVGLGGLTGFGIVHPLPGIWDEFKLNTAITLPIGVETYAAYALRVWLSGRVPRRARRFARNSALGSLALGALGQIAYHLMTAAGMTTAPWPITTLVACLPVAVLGMGAALTHLLHATDSEVSR